MHFRFSLSTIVCAIAMLAASPAWAVLAYNTMNNDSAASLNAAPGLSDPGFDNVGIYSGASAVYLGSQWAITAHHVGSTGGVILGGTVYSVDQTVRLQNPDTTDTDLRLLHLTTDPGLPSVDIAPSFPGIGSDVVMIGRGLLAEDSDQNDIPDLKTWYVTENSSTDWDWSTSPAGGYDFTHDGFTQSSSGSRGIRWGTNTIDGTEVFDMGSSGEVDGFYTTFDQNLPARTSDEAQALRGDSGGAVFHYNGSNWELIGLMHAVGTFNDQQEADPYGTPPNAADVAVYGNLTYASDLSVYRDQITAAIPEPTSLLLLAAALGMYAATSRRQRFAHHRDASGR
jgi:hypothetical protein